MITPNWLKTAFLGAALAASTSVGLSQATDWIQTFDTSTSTGPWSVWWGTATITWDGTQDCTTNVPGSGAMTFVAPFVGASGEQFMTFAGFHYGWGWDGTTVLDGTLYTNLIFDIKMDPSTAPAVNGTDLGQLAIGFTAPSWPSTGVPQVGNYTIPLTATNWTHVVLPVNPTTIGMASINGIYIKMWSDGHLTNTWTAYFDNLELQAIPTNIPPRPPPTMTLEKAGLSGVEIIMDGTGDQWQRNAISTPSGGGPYLWTSQGSYPVSYSCTITNFPDIANHLGFEAHMYLVNGDTAGSGTDVSGSADWGAPDLLIFRIENNLSTVLTTNGATITTNSTYNAMAQIQWKTNYPNANATNIPVVVYPPSALGTWTVTFTDSTNGTLTGPGITATSFTLPADAVLNNFSPATSFLQFGMFKNDGPNDGHNNGAHGTYSHVQFTGAPANSFDDAFTGATLTNKYAWRVTDPNYVQYIPPGAAWIVDWTLPANGFSLETKAALGPGFWTSPAITGYDQGGFHHGLLLSSDLPGTNSGYFRLTKRVATQLQVLLPGETNAPNTTIGKIGTPVPQATLTPFDVTVNACDATWHIVTSCSDTVDITSSDPSAYLPTDAPLVNGTITFLGTGNFFSFVSTGTWTIRASDVTTNAIANGVSTPITISQ
jgi:hypothetical protein